MKHHYSIHDLLFIESNIKLDLSKLLPTIAPTEYRKPPNISIRIQRRVNMDTSKLTQLDKFYSKPNLGFIYYKNKFHRRPYNFHITDILSNTTIRATRPTLRPHPSFPTSLYDTINTIVQIKLLSLNLTHINATFIQTPTSSPILLISPLPPSSPFHASLITARIQNNCTILSQGKTLISQDGTFYSIPRPYSPPTPKTSLTTTIKKSIISKINNKVTTLSQQQKRESAIALPISQTYLLSPTPTITPHSLTTKIMHLNEFHFVSPSTSIPLHAYAYFNDNFQLHSLTTQSTISTCILHSPYSTLPFNQNEILNEILNP